MEFCKRIGCSLLRIWLGYLWLATGITKVQSDAWTGMQSGTEVTRFLQEAIARSTASGSAVPEWYVNAAQSYGLPHAQFLSYLLTYCEIFLGIALLLGIFTTATAALGCLLNLAYLLSNVVGDNPLMYAVAVMVVVSGSAAGYYGIDRYILPWLKQLLRNTVRSFQLLLSRIAGA